jgi:hypothetical protein
MQKLIEGLHRFQEGYFSSQRALFERLATGQHPETLFIWVYKIESGEVFGYAADRGQFLRLTSQRPAAALPERTRVVTEI